MKTLIIYFNEEKTSRQVVKPSEFFKGNYSDLAWDISGGHYHSYSVV